MTVVVHRVLVTGAAGQLGTEVVALLRARGIEVTALLLEPVATSATRVVVGDMRDRDAVRRSLEGVDGVVHCAALRAPMMGTPEEVFCGNTAGTFTVLQEAADLGVRRAVIASSYSVLGLTFAPEDREPAYLPIDEDVPPQIEDPYAFSKLVDEETARYMARCHGMTVVALRFPFLGDLDGTIRERSGQVARDPAAQRASREFWTYLDLRDAARACLLALTVPDTGAHVVSVAAPTTLAPYPTEQLLDRYHPTVPRRQRFDGHAAPFDLGRARRVLGFEAEHILPVQARDLQARHLETR